MPTHQNQSKKALINDLRPLITHMSQAATLVIVKTVEGAAQAVAASIDTLNLKMLKGSIAGDDTIFLACNSNEEANLCLQTLLNFKSED